MAEHSLAPWRPRKRWRGQSSTAVDEYDVFLNHRGPDVKAGFIAHLEEALGSVGLNPFLDKTSLLQGDRAIQSIDAALEVARVHVAVVSEGYAESKYCLSELVAMLRSAKPVIPVFYDVEPSALRWVEKGRFAEAFEKHKTRETAEQVQEWKDALCKLAEITGFCFRSCDYKGDEAKLKWEVVEAVISQLPMNEAVQVEHHLVGLDNHVNSCITKLEKMSGSTRVVCITGMGGVGKTTLAKEIYNHLVGEKKFQAVSFLEIDRIAPSSNEVGLDLLSKLQKQLLWDLLHVSDGNRQRYNYWFNKISSQGPILVVLDDLQDKMFDKLICNTRILALGSCIIVTSRDRHVLKLITRGCNFYLHEVTPLSRNDSQKLFNLHAFGNEEAPKNFNAIANDVRKACGGLPLALKVVGSSLFDTTLDEDHLEHIWPEAIDALKGDPNIMDALRWSYNCLSESEKLMFVDIACTFHGFRSVEALKIWKSCKKCASCCGDGTPYTTLKHLIDKSLVTVEILPGYGNGYLHGSGVLSMHGLLRIMGQSIGTDEGSHLWESDRSANFIENRNQISNKVRTLNLTNNWKHKLEVEKFPKMPNLHFLILDGCDVTGDLGSISNEVRWMRWRYMPLPHLPPLLNMFNLVSLDFSESTKLANTWAESDPSMKGCPNLLKLDLTGCTSITALPQSIGHLSSLQVLDLDRCQSLRKLPDSVGQLTSLQHLRIQECRSLEALPDSVFALPKLQHLLMWSCDSMSNLQMASIGLPTSLTRLITDLVSKGQVESIGQLNALKELEVRQCNDEAITALTNSGALRNLDQLSDLDFCDDTFMTKLPQTIGLLKNLRWLHLYNCQKVQELPNSLGQLKLLRILKLRKCKSLEALPDSLGGLISLKILQIVQCTSLTKLPASMGHLSSLCQLMIDGCSSLQTLPDSLRQLSSLESVTIMDCGTLEDLGVLRMLQGLSIWGCTSITELPGSCLDLLDGNVRDPTWMLDLEEYYTVHRNLREVQMVEVNDCGFLRLVQDDSPSERLILQRVHKLPCCKLMASSMEG